MPELFTIYVVDKTPLPDTTASNETLISFDVWRNMLIDISPIVIHVNGDVAYDGASFVAPFDGPSSDVSLISDGYRYHFVIDSTTKFYGPVSLLVETQYYTYFGNWSFNTLWFEVLNKVPLAGASGVNENTLISFDCVSNNINNVDIFDIGINVAGSDTFSVTRNVSFGPTITFTKANFEITEDIISDAVHLARDDSKGLYNNVLESSYDDGDYLSPLDTEWTFYDVPWGDLSDVATREYFDWAEALDWYPAYNLVGYELVMHIKTEDRYFKFMFNDWAVGQSNPGGGFSYDRTEIFLSDDISFLSPFNGPSSSVTEIIDGYSFVINKTSAYAIGEVPVSVISTDFEENWSFFVGDVNIYFLNKSPTPDSIMVSETTDVSFDVTSEVPLNKSSLKVYIDGTLACDGGVFLPPFNTDSEITEVNISGIDGYNVVLRNDGIYDNFVDVVVEVYDMGSNYKSTAWSFLIDEEINTLYFCDGYGVKKINVSGLVGESQSVVKTFLSTETIPNIPHNSVASLSGNRLEDGYFYLAMSYNNFSYPDGYGIVVAKNENALDTYSDGYACLKGQITNDGKLYIINKDNNCIEVYYGLAEFFGGVARSPDFIYSSTSTPSIMAGEILSFHIVSGVSTKFAGGTRLYVGTENGLNRIECYDKKNPDGTQFGTDSLGISYSYSISGGSGTYKAIGGTIPRVTSISSDEENNIFMVVTQDGLGDGGVTQISLLTNRKIVFMNRNSGFVPSNRIRDIWGKGGRQ